MPALISLLILIIVLGIVIGICWYIIDLMPFLPAPFKQAAKMILLLVALLILLLRALPMAGVTVY